MASPWPSWRLPAPLPGAFRAPEAGPGLGRPVPRGEGDGEGSGAKAKAKGKAKAKAPGWTQNGVRMVGSRRSASVTGCPANAA